MRKVIAAINMSIDGFCDHTIGIPDEELHDHYSDLISNADIILYGRITYQLMEYWREVLENPTGHESTDRFANIIDKIPKIVFSHTLKNLVWNSAELATTEPEEVVKELKGLKGGNILIGSPGLIAHMTELQLIDEYQLCIHPVIAGHGLPLFKNISEIHTLQLFNTKILGSGAIVLYYKSEH